ncbi:MAG: hypothetical protein HC794_07375 [Nitrospiraceae bacterium]|nr:hypothetical protein [Nitrospiraceae bacterium]
MNEPRCRPDLISFLFLCALLAITGCGSPTQAAVSPPAPVQAAVAPDASLPRLLPERLAIPTIDLDTRVVELGWSATRNKAGQIFSEWDVAEFAAGWHKTAPA